MMYNYQSKLIRVIDGDTIDAMVDLGFDIWIKVRIRLYGINTPETRTKDLKEKKAGLKAKQRLIDILEEAEGKFSLVSHGVDKYGRCLGTIVVETVSINNLLVQEGLAKVYVL